MTAPQQSSSCKSCGEAVFDRTKDPGRRQICRITGSTIFTNTTVRRDCPKKQPPAADADTLLDFVRLVETKNREMAALMRRNKIKISNLEDPMQKLAFTFYTEIGELAHKAGVLLAEHEAALPRGEQHE